MTIGWLRTFVHFFSSSDWTRVVLQPGASWQKAHKKKILECKISMDSSSWSTDKPLHLFSSKPFRSPSDVKETNHAGCVLVGPGA